MVLSRVHRRCFAWVAFLAILLAACAPTLSQLSQSQHAATWVQVCRAQGGTTWVALDALGASQAIDPSADPSADPSRHPTPLRGQPHLLDHCPYCSVHTDALPPTPSLPRIAQVGVAAMQVPRAFLHAPHTAHPWRPEQSRAPPSLV